MILHLELLRSSQFNLEKQHYRQRLSWWHSGKASACALSSQYLWNFGPKVLVLFGVLQEIYKLHDLQLGFFTTSHVCKPHADVILDDFGYCLTNAKEAPSSPTMPSPHRTPPHDIEEDANQEKGGHQASQERPRKAKKTIRHIPLRDRP